MPQPATDPDTWTSGTVAVMPWWSTSSTEQQRQPTQIRYDSPVVGSAVRPGPDSANLNSIVLVRSYYYCDGTGTHAASHGAWLLVLACCWQTQNTGPAASLSQAAGQSSDSDHPDAAAGTQAAIQVMIITSTVTAVTLTGQGRRQTWKQIWLDKTPWQGTLDRRRDRSKTIMISNLNVTII